MGIRKITMMQCDNPRCLEEFEHTKNDPAPGYHFNGGGVYIGGGAPIPKVYAHAKECITPAILYMIDVENDWNRG